MYYFVLFPLCAISSYLLFYFISFFFFCPRTPQSVQRSVAAGGVNKLADCRRTFQTRWRSVTGFSDRDHSMPGIGGTARYRYRLTFSNCFFLVCFLCAELLTDRIRKILFPMANTINDILFISHYRNTLKQRTRTTGFCFLCIVPSSPPSNCPALINMGHRHSLINIHLGAQRAHTHIHARIIDNG